MPETAYIDAVVHYRTKFPSKASLGEGDPPAAWKAELDHVTPAAFDDVVGTSVQSDGGSMSGVLNFRQMFKVRALHAVRAERDPDYLNPYLEPVSEPMAGRRIGFLVHL